MPHAPRWIENDLRHATNPLATSLEQTQATALELIDFCRRLGVPFGLNVESVSIRREEFEASVDRAARLTTYVRTWSRPGRVSGHRLLESSRAHWRR